MRASISLCLVSAVLALLAPVAPAAGPIVSTAALASPKLQEDFPALCLDKTGQAWVAYVQWDGKTDVLRVARQAGAGLKALGKIAGPGVIHQPAIACDGKGAVWVIWSQVNDKVVMNLHAQKLVDGKPAGKAVVLADSPRADVYADAGTDAAGRVWVAWQSFRNGAGDVYARCYDPRADTWSDAIQVTKHAEGDWEPRLAFDKDGAAIAFDTCRNGNYDVYLARVSPAGKVKIQQVTSTEFYEARPAIAAAAGGKGFWLAWEKGRKRWGRDARGGGNRGLNTDKDVEVAFLDAATGKLTRTPPVKPVVAQLLASPAGGGPAAKKAPAKRPGGKAPAKKPAPKRPGRQGAGGVQALNLPELVVDGKGTCWLAVRYGNGVLWNVALLAYDPAAKAWSQPTALPQSPFGQDRRLNAVTDADGAPWLCWPSDLRTSKRALMSGVYLAKLDPAAALPAAQAAQARPGRAEPEYDAKNVWGGTTPDRPRDQHNVWEIGGKKYTLYFGDFHRHTDVSNCLTVRDGCIAEQFRYAYDMARLDFLGTSDHTDVGKPYDPYEWWCNQKLTDVFFAPGFFTSFYVYEREQRWPWGHRNVIFTERGGPIVYIKRALYQSMPWNKLYPIGEGPADIQPPELWKVLRDHGKKVTVISHTGATGMGTDWTKYAQIDNAVENLIEIYQGCRVSYEGVGLPQPLVGQPKGAKGPEQSGQNFGQFNNGVYQKALKQGWKLGVFANSDHISANVSFGGVYVENFTREGILEGLNARRTFGATDKIFVEFTCNGKPMGTIFGAKGKPQMQLAVRGTAPLLSVTIVRNEENIRRFEPKTKDAKDLEASFTDEDPVEGENRYYVRVVQADGNMAWCSPVWVTVTK